MMAKKKLVATISIITLILAITAGIVLSVGAQPINNGYVGEDVQLLYTGVDVITGTLTQTSESPAGTKISTDAELMAFLRGSDTDGYLADNITLDWDTVGSQIKFDEGRTIDGNGYTVTLKDDQANGGTADGYVDTLGNHGGINYGMFVDYNAGTIKNIKFVYEQSSHSLVNNGTVKPNYVGIVCGTNAPTGVISNCDITISGTFKYDYNKGKLSSENWSAGDTIERNGFAIHFGGIAGRNAGKITNIVADYKDFTSNLYVKASNEVKNVFITWQNRANARISAGGIAGTMSYFVNKPECSNIIIKGRNTNFNISGNENQNTGTDERAYIYMFGAAVVASNSAYSRAEGQIGQAVGTQGIVDNIITDFQGNFSGIGISGTGLQQGKIQAPKEASINAVVYCGKATNVTILNMTRDNFVSSQHVDYQTDHCNCGVSGNAGENHETGYGNLVKTGDYTDVYVSLDENGNQVITAEPKNHDYSIIGEVKFNKFATRGTDGTAEQIETGTPDNATYSNVANNGSTYLYANETDRMNYTFRIRPYQDTSNKFWEFEIYSYQYATISENDALEGWAREYTYTGFDYLTQQLKYTTIEDGKVGTVRPSGLYAVLTEDGESVITSGRLPGEYSFNLKELRAGLSYVDTVNKIVARATDTADDEYTFTVNKADMQVKGFSDLSELANWTNQERSLEFEVIGGIENAADGYIYEVNGSQYPISGLTMIHSDSTPTAGRSYTVCLTSGGVQVTNPISYTIKIDLDNPLVSIPQYEHPADKYYTHNKITIDARDNTSGIYSLWLYSYNAVTGELEHSHDIKAECESTDEEFSNSYIDENGRFVWYFKDTGKKEIEAMDNAGNSSKISVNVKIDNYVPTIDVDAYYIAPIEGIGPDNEPIVTPTKIAYASGDTTYYAVYFEATATFGESGGVIQYSYDNEEWFDYEEGVPLTVKESKNVIFRAQSNTYDHHDNYPYYQQYQLTTYWSENINIGADGKEEIVPFEVIVTLEQVTITVDDIIVTGTTKTFDGTNEFKGEVTVTDEFKTKINGDIIFTIAYRDVNAGDEVAISISAVCNDDTKVLVSDIADVIGKIEKKGITVTVHSKDKYYGYSLPELTCDVEGMIDGFAEDVQLYVVKGEGFEDIPYELLPQTERDETRDGYLITVVEGTTFANYVIATLNTGKLHVDLAPVDRLHYEIGAFTGLDTKNIATRNLEIGFIRANGNYEKLNVKFERRTYVEGNDGSIRETYVEEKDMTKAHAGFYRVTVSLPEFDAKNESLWNKYEMSSKISTFMIKVINASIFPEEEKEPEENADETAKDDTAKEEAPVINNGANGQVGVYEEGSANTDNTDMTIEPAQQKKDYIAMISIFCAVAITIAFAIGVGRAITKRIRR